MYLQILITTRTVSYGLFFKVTGYLKIQGLQFRVFKQHSLEIPLLLHLWFPKKNTSPAHSTRFTVICLHCFLRTQGSSTRFYMVWWKIEKKILVLCQHPANRLWSFNSFFLITDRWGSTTTWPSSFLPTPKTKGW